MNPTLRILVADDHEVVRLGLRALLEAELGWQVCAEAATGREAVEQAARTRPHVAIVDVGMPELNGCEATRQIHKVVPTCEVLILTVYSTEAVVREALAAGARGFMLKSDAGRNLVAAVDALRRHTSFFGSAAAELLRETYLQSGAADAGSASASERLTGREREVLQLLAEGKTTKDVARLLGITVKTADTHRTRIMAKLGLHSVVELVHYAIRNQLVEP
jgi:DNA-binding NarL/FixJ family response regulator